MIGQPIGIIREAFVELAGGKLQNEQQHQEITDIVSQHLVSESLSIPKLNISKTGSSYLVVIGVSLADLKQQEETQWQTKKDQLSTALTEKYPFIDVEVVVV